MKAGPAGGIIPLDWSDIAAFVSAMQMDLEPWEVQTIRDMSIAYAQGLHEGRSLFSIMPSERDD